MIGFETLYKWRNPLVLKCGSFSEDLYVLRLTKSYSLPLQFDCLCKKTGAWLSMLCLCSMSLDIPATNIVLTASTVEEHETLQCWWVLNGICKNAMSYKAYATNMERTEWWLSACKTLI